MCSMIDSGEKGYKLPEQILFNSLVLYLTLDKRCLSHGMCLYQVMMTMHFLNDIAKDAESTQKSKLRHIR